MSELSRAHRVYVAACVVALVLVPAAVVYLALVLGAEAWWWT